MKHHACLVHVFSGYHSNGVSSELENVDHLKSLQSFVISVSHAADLYCVESPTVHGAQRRLTVTNLPHPQIV